MNNLVDFTGKHILVMGASTGIGATTAITLNKLGANVDIMARNEEALHEVLNEMENNGHNAVYKLDVTDFDSINEAVSLAVTEQGPYDGFVYAIGVALNSPLPQNSLNKIEWIFKTNYFGFVESVRQITKKGRFNPGMRIVGISSVAALRGDISQTLYSGTKAAMDGSVRSMAPELAKKGICINTVAPGMVNTKKYLNYVKDYGTEGIRYEILKDRQFRGIGETQDVANAIVFLLSPAARMITGVCMPVDGGYRI